MKIILRLVLLLLLPTLMCRGAQWYVSTNGNGDGSLGNPWFLQTALTNSAIKPGDTVWLRGGTYFPTATWPDWNVNVLGWLPSVKGTTNSLITFRSYTNEWAAIDRRWNLKPSASHLRFMDLEFYDSLKGHNLTNSQYPNGPWVHFAGGQLESAGFEWINCVIHDVGNCWGGGAAGNAVRGCILWHVGWNNQEHVCYGPPYTFAGNISAWHYNDVIEHSFTNFVMKNNIIFGTGANNNGAGGGRDAMVDGGGQIISNYFYNRFDFVPVHGYPQTLSYITASSGGALAVSNNIIIGPNPVVYDTTISNNFKSVFFGNTVYANNALYTAPVIGWYGSSGSSAFDYNNYFSTTTVTFNNAPGTGYGTTFAQWKAFYPNFDTHSTASDSTTPADSVQVIPNVDQLKRCHIAIYSWTKKDNVRVSLSGVLDAGDSYRLYSAQNYNGGAIQSGIYNGANIMVPMTNLTTAPILYGTNVNYSGETLSRPVPTSPEFGAFVVIGAKPHGPLPASGLQVAPL